MSKITLLDPVPKRWHEQIATSAGNRMPSPKLHFCTLGIGELTKSNDNKRSYERSVFADNDITLGRHDRRL